MSDLGLNKSASAADNNPIWVPESAKQQQPNAGEIMASPCPNCRRGLLLVLVGCQQCGASGAAPIIQAVLANHEKRLAAVERALGLGRPPVGAPAAEGTPTSPVASGEVSQEATGGAGATEGVSG